MRLQLWVKQSFLSHQKSPCLVSDHEGKVDLLDTVSDVKRAVAWGTCSVECSEAGPDAAPQHDEGHVDLVHLDGPALLRLLQGSIVKELVIEDVLLARSQVNFIFLFKRSQLHV